MAKGPTVAAKTVVEPPARPPRDARPSSLDVARAVDGPFRPDTFCPRVGRPAPSATVVGLETPAAVRRGGPTRRVGVEGVDVAKKAAAVALPSSRLVTVATARPVTAPRPVTTDTPTAFPAQGGPFRRPVGPVREDARGRAPTCPLPAKRPGGVQTRGGGEPRHNGLDALAPPVAEVETAPATGQTRHVGRVPSVGGRGVDVVAGKPVTVARPEAQDPDAKAEADGAALPDRPVRDRRVAVLTARPDGGTSGVTRPPEKADLTGMPVDGTGEMAPAFVAGPPCGRGPDPASRETAATAAGRPGPRLRDGGDSMFLFPYAYIFFEGLRHFTE